MTYYEHLTNKIHALEGVSLRVNDKDYGKKMHEKAFKIRRDRDELPTELAISDYSEQSKPFVPHKTWRVENGS